MWVWVHGFDTQDHFVLYRYHYASILVLIWVQVIIIHLIQNNQKRTNGNVSIHSIQSLFTSGITVCASVDVNSDQAPVSHESNDSIWKLKTMDTNLRAFYQNKLCKHYIMLDLDAYRAVKWKHPCQGEKTAAAAAKAEKKMKTTFLSTIHENLIVICLWLPWEACATNHSHFLSTAAFLFFFFLFLC